MNKQQTNNQTEGHTITKKDKQQKTIIAERSKGGAAFIFSISQEFRKISLNKHINQYCSGTAIAQTECKHFFLFVEPGCSAVSFVSKFRCG